MKTLFANNETNIFDLFENINKRRIKYGKGKRSYWS